MGKLLRTAVDAAVEAGSVPTVKHADLGTTALTLDCIYQGGSAGHSGDDPLGKLLPVGNQGGIRYNGSRSGVRLLVLYTTLADADWPDRLDPETGSFTYFGDNKRPGKELHDTPRRGNLILKSIFDATHEEPARRHLVPPVFIFSKGARGRDCIFRGLAAPGAPGARPTEDLVALWRSKDGARFQNYKALFTILDVAIASRQWITDIVAGAPLSDNCPEAWRSWVATGHYQPLTAPRVIEHRRRLDQLPTGPVGNDIVAAIRAHFADDPYEFERCAVEIAKLMDSNIIGVELTRRTADGGRDAIGLYRIGPASDSIKLDFALEAKCYAANNSVGVQDISRLISRLRHRQFGILVTTSFVAEQAYAEVREDRHPVVIIAAGDIVQILATKGLTTRAAVEAWLRAEFPREHPAAIPRSG